MHHSFKSGFEKLSNLKVPLSDFKEILHAPWYKGSPKTLSRDLIGLENDVRGVARDNLNRQAAIAEHRAKQRLKEIAPHGALDPRGHMQGGDYLEVANSYHDLDAARNQLRQPSHYESVSANP